MSAANPNPMEKSMVSVLVVANAGGWSPLPCGVLSPTTTAPAEKDGWKTVAGKAAQTKRRNEKADNERAATTASNTPKMKNGGRGKNTHQPKPTTPSAKKTWAEVVKSGGINVQIVLGNGNLGLATPPTKKRGERRGGAARRLGRKEGVGERGEERWGKVGRPGAGGTEASTTGGGGERVEERRGGGGPAAVQRFFCFRFVLLCRGNIVGKMV
jgi:hypothetical protein